MIFGINFLRNVGYAEGVMAQAIGRDHTPQDTVRVFDRVPRRGH